MASVIEEEENALTLHKPNKAHRQKETKSENVKREDKRSGSGSEDEEWSLRDGDWSPQKKSKAHIGHRPNKIRAPGGKKCSELFSEITLLIS